jgi:hypothetical protein
MIKLVTILSSLFGSQNKRVIKVNSMGKGNTQTGLQASPYGIDSNPIPGLIGVYTQSSEMGKTALLGYLNKEMIADVGEIRTFATDADGVEKAYIWLKNDETIEIGGDVDNLIRYAPLNSSIQGMSTDINAELVKIATGITAAGGTYTPTPVLVDLSAAKIDDIKTR